MGEKLGLKAQRRLEKMGVEIQLDAMVTKIDADGIVVKEKDGTERRIDAACKVWSAGVPASPLGKILTDQSDGTEVDRAGRVIVEHDLTIKGHRNVFVIGDLMAVPGVPGQAQGAIQGAKYATKHILGGLKGENPEQRPPFKYFDKGSMATVSRFSAVAQVGKIEFGGFIAWVSWLALHLYYLVGYRSRIMTIFSWAVTFLGRGRGRWPRPSSGLARASRSSRSNARNTRSWREASCSTPPRPPNSTRRRRRPSSRPAERRAPRRGPDTMPETISGHGGVHVVAAAQAHGVSTMFTLSGGHIFPIYDGAVHAGPPLRMIDVRAEHTAVFAAEATGKLTRSPGLAVVTAGPGVTNAVSADHAGVLRGLAAGGARWARCDHELGQGQPAGTRPPAAAGVGHQARRDRRVDRDHRGGGRRRIPAGRHRAPWTGVPGLSDRSVVRPRRRAHAAADPRRW